jgi:hypothetical protein
MTGFCSLNTSNWTEDDMSKNLPHTPQAQKGRIGYLVLYFLGAPVGLLLVLWLILGDNIFGPG